MTHAPKHEESPGRLRRVLLRAAEGALALLFVLAFFTGFLVILALSFPAGSGLESLMLSRNWIAGPRHTPRIDAATPEPPAPIIARLLRARRSVKDRRPDAITWKVAPIGQPLERGHSVQTFDRAAATIAFDRGNTLDVGANSLVVLRDLGPRGTAGARRAETLVLTGELTGASSGADDLALELVAATGSRMVVRDGGSAQFRLTNNPDRSATFIVYEGRADVSSAGETLRIGPHQAVTVEPSGLAGAPVELPAGLEPLAPPAAATYVYRSLPPRVLFRWSGDARAEAYRLLIARDPEWSEVIADERVSGTEFVHGNLPEGRVYWRVSGLTGWAESAPTSMRRLELRRDTAPPRLDVVFPDAPAANGQALLRGTVEPGSEVFVDDRPLVPGADGSFEVALPLEPGTNVVVVEAIDPAGNITYRSKIVSVPGSADERTR